MVDPNANIIFGAVIDDRLQGEMRITVIATGFTKGESQAPPPSPPARSTAKPISPPPPPTVENKEKPGLDIPDFLQRRRPFR